jgi:hypothetical protein
METTRYCAFRTGIAINRKHKMLHDKKPKMEILRMALNTKIKNYLYSIKMREGDPYMDGYVTSKAKRELFEIYWYIEDMLEDCGTYVGEDEWKAQREKDKMLNKLSGETRFGKD